MCIRDSVSIFLYNSLVQNAFWGRRDARAGALGGARRGAREAREAPASLRPRAAPPAVLPRQEGPEREALAEVVREAAVLHHAETKRFTEFLNEVFKNSPFLVPNLAAAEPPDGAVVISAPGRKLALISAGPLSPGRLAGVTPTRHPDRDALVELVGPVGAFFLDVRCPLACLKPIVLFATTAEVMEPTEEPGGGTIWGGV